MFIYRKKLVTQDQIGTTEYDRMCQKPKKFQISLVVLYSLLWLAWLWLGGSFFFVDAVVVFINKQQTSLMIPVQIGIDSFVSDVGCIKSISFEAEMLSEFP